MIDPDAIREIAEEIEAVGRADQLGREWWAKIQSPRVADRLRLMARAQEDARDAVAGDAWQAEHDRNVLEGLIQHGMRTGKIAYRILPTRMIRDAMKERVL